MTTLEIIVCILLGGLWALSIWFNIRSRKAQAEYNRQQQELKKELDRLDKNVTALHNDLRLIFPMSHSELN